MSTPITRPGASQPKPVFGTAFSVASDHDCAVAMTNREWDTPTSTTTLNLDTQVLDGSLRAAVAKVGSEPFTIVHRWIQRLAAALLVVAIKVSPSWHFRVELAKE